MSINMDKTNVNSLIMITHILSQTEYVRR